MYGNFRIKNTKGAWRDGNHRYEDDGHWWNGSAMRSVIVIRRIITFKIGCAENSNCRLIRLSWIVWKW